MKARMISRLTGPSAVSASALSREVGIPQATLSRWLQKAGTMGSMTKPKKDPTPKSPRDWPLEQKLRVVLEAITLSDQELGAFLRKEGLHEAQLQEMLSSVKAAFSDQKKKPSKKVSSEKKAIKKLEKELARKDKALAEVTALLVLKKKLETYFSEDEEEGTKRKSGR